MTERELITQSLLDYYEDITSVSAPPYQEYGEFARARAGWKIANTLWQLT